MYRYGGPGIVCFSEASVIVRNVFALLGNLEVIAVAVKQNSCHFLLVIVTDHSEIIQQRRFYIFY